AGQISRAVRHDCRNSYAGFRWRRHVGRRWNHRAYINNVSDAEPTKSEALMRFDHGLCDRFHARDWIDEMAISTADIVDGDAKDRIVFFENQTAVLHRGQFRREQEIDWIIWVETKIACGFRYLAGKREPARAIDRHHRHFVLPQIGVKPVQPNILSKRQRS